MLGVLRQAYEVYFSAPDIIFIDTESPNDIMFSSVYTYAYVPAGCSYPGVHTYA